MDEPIKHKSFFKVLAIDGGGFRGIYPAHILARMEKEWSVRWTDQFNLIAGTSTGAIIAAGLTCGISANDICNLYKDQGSHIFRKHPLRRLGLFASRYKNDTLSAALKKVFGDRCLGDIKTPLIIPTTDIVNGCVHVLKSAYDPGFVRDKDVLVRDAVLASCSAPTYFDPYRLTHYVLADGGLWANNPALVAAIDAKRRLGVELAQLRILSLGTGTSMQFYPLKASFLSRFSGWGFVTRWRRERFINMLLNLQAETANNILNLLLEKEQVLRLTFKSNVPLSLDDVRELGDLISKADRDFSHHSEVLQRFIAEDRGR